MDPRYTPLNVTVAVLAVLTAWVLIARYRGSTESNWPLLYYFGVVFFSVTIPGILDPAWVYAGVVCALLLRFEFMGGVFLKLIHLIDYVVLAYIFYATLSSLAL